VPSGILPGFRIRDTLVRLQITGFYRGALLMTGDAEAAPEAARD
jgi:hypothetical protein